MAKQLYREKALEAYSTPEQRGGLLHLVAPSVSRLFVAIAALFVFAIVASVFLRVSVTTRGRGIVRPQGGVFVMRAVRPGVVQSVEVEVGQSVAPGDVLVRLDEPVVATVSGSVDAVAVRPGEHVTAGAPLVKVLPAAERLVGFVALPAKDRPHLDPGQPVQIAFDGFPSSEMGFGRGVIEHVAEDVLSAELARPYLAEEPACGGPCTLVALRIDDLPERAGGKVKSGMPFEAVVTVRRPRIISLLLPPLGAVLGP